jgi:hypothetical protein
MDIKNFDTTQRLLIAACPKGLNLKNVKKLQKLQKLGCKVDLKSTMYYNINLQSIVSYQKTSTSQRYLYGGMKYAVG